MKYFSIIFLIGFLWLTRDIIRVPENFGDSFFKRFKGHKWIDPEVSCTNQYVLGYWMSFIISTFSDLYHTLGTIIVLVFFTCVYFAEPFPIPYLAFIIIALIIFGAGAFLAQWLWREKLNKKEDETKR